MKNFAIFLTFVFVTMVHHSAFIESRATSEQLEGISLRFYGGQTLEDYVTVLVGNSVDLLEYLDPSKPTVLYISGWSETPDSLSVSTIFGAYLQRKDHNMLLADYTEIASQDYISAILSAESVGITLSKCLNNLVESGLDATTLHIVSHSLGSQIAGFLGSNINFVLPRITALDPAGPGFHILLTSLSSDAAESVDVILTDAGIYGNALIKGTVTFYPNGGTRIQPGCPLIFVPMSDEAFCSHHRSWYYYAESLLNETAFVGTQCDSYIGFKFGWCKSNDKVVMGYGTPRTASGKVYLETGKASPFGLGNDDA